MSDHSSLGRLARRQRDESGARKFRARLAHRHPQTLEGLPNDAPKAGDRFPWLKARIGGEDFDVYERLDDTEFNLVVVGQEAQASGIRTCTIPSDAFNNDARDGVKIPSPSFYLLRPDGYVGLCGKLLDERAVKAYLSERLHFTSP